MKLKPKEEKILQLLKSKTGQVIPAKSILLSVETNPVKRMMFEELWDGKETRKKYRDILRTSINEIRKKTGARIQNVMGVGYKFEKV